MKLMNIELSVEESATVIAALEGWMDAFVDELPEEAARVRTVIEKMYKASGYRRTFQLGSAKHEAAVIKIQELIKCGQFDLGDEDMSLASPFRIVDKITAVFKASFPDVPLKDIESFAQEQARQVIEAYWENKKRGDE